MKKILLTSFSLLLITGCTKQVDTKPISLKSAKLLDKYGISESALIKMDNNYIFVVTDANGAAIYKLNKNYEFVEKNITPILLDPIKTKVTNNAIYILGYDQNKNRVALIKYDKNLKLKQINYYGSKYDLGRDFVIDKNNIFVATTHFSPTKKSDIIIYNDKNKITYSTPYMDNVYFIKLFKNGLLIAGSTTKTSEDAFLVYKTFDNKTIWKKSFDLGMNETPINIKIKNNLIYLQILSSDNMGAEKYFDFIIDQNGKIKSIKKGIEFKKLPTKFRT